jgi:hypothetical protein
MERKALNAMREATLTDCEGPGLAFTVSGAPDKWTNGSSIAKPSSL